MLTQCRRLHYSEHLRDHRAPRVIRLINNIFADPLQFRVLGALGAHGTQTPSCHRNGNLHYTCGWFLLEVSITQVYTP